jgi:methylenetetrahydrofolate dehydrogenase (NADP+)/methenyltetrahydrofolate cyclohydrolase
MAELVDGKMLRNNVLDTLRERVRKLKTKPKLAIILVGNDEASLRYIKQKQKAAEEIGVESELIHLPVNLTQIEVEKAVEKLNSNSETTGIIVQLPLPDTIHTKEVLQKIDSSKDVDGLTPSSPFKPATPLGIMEIFREYDVVIEGKTVVVIGQSNLVGSPLSQMLEEQGAKVIRIDINTPKPIDFLVQQGDIVVAAVGQPNLVTSEMVKAGVVVIDVGTNLTDEGKLVGDVDFESVSQKAKLITPVPGGVGPMTVAMLLSNLVKAAENP